MKDRSVHNTDLKSQRGRISFIVRGVVVEHVPGFSFGRKMMCHAIQCSIYSNNKTDGALFRIYSTAL